MDTNVYSRDFSKKLTKTLSHLLKERPVSATELAVELGLVAADAPSNEVAQAATFCRTAVRTICPDVLIGKNLGFHTEETPKVSRGRTATPVEPEFVEAVMSVLRRSGPMAAARIVASIPGQDPVDGLAKLRNAYKRGELPGVQASKRVGFRLVAEDDASQAAE